MKKWGILTSLLLVLLRKKLAEFDATSSEPRLILSRDDMIEMVRLFLPDTANQVIAMSSTMTMSSVAPSCFGKCGARLMALPAFQRCC